MGEGDTDLSNFVSFTRWWGGVQFLEINGCVKSLKSINQFVLFLEVKLDE